MVEPFAFGGGAAPTAGLSAGQRNGTLSVPAPADRDRGRSNYFTLGNATSSSSYAPGEEFANLPALSSLGLELGYWSPSDAAPQNRDTMFGDGGDVENPNIISMLQRRVRSIVVVLNMECPLSTTFDPADTAKVSTKDMDDEVPPFFGIFPIKNSSDPGYFGERAGSVCELQLKLKLKSAWVVAHSLTCPPSLHSHSSLILIIHTRSTSTMMHTATMH
jgi:hypothetical protein